MAKAKPVADLVLSASVAENAEKILHVRLKEFYQWEQYVDEPYEVANLHNLRIAAKRLRYTLEIFAEALPEDAALLLTEVEQIQEELGNLHDTDVLIALLRLRLGSLDGGTGYEEALLSSTRKPGKSMFSISPALVSQLLAPHAAPTAVERQGLEILLQKLQQKRKAFYLTFREHWYQLKGHDFYHQVLQLNG
ncbi:CHAD domain-containing protein [Tengunoibacter tsumagoiensis]|uniref:CHAD domain-containing protein n=1 Tax=Tengunoibacter tsumagoiensis TaxID=2014871 RepID=A0A401ZXH8_9CHLR|nr:CHAD domain-containing protein [Tengunoibacter tsumagoiensis]GCE11549.1 hypothetical protein KTT_14080 [Tengunoibacter tsumagoiensis]